MSRSRGQATEWIKAGLVRVDGEVQTKPAGKVGTHSVIVVHADDAHVVGRGALKLIAALDRFQVSPRGRRVLDAGASTGGFTQVVLERGAETVIAVDVGHGQLAPHLVADSRVLNLEGTNLRYLQGDVAWAPVDLVVADLSFISLTLVVPVLAALSTASAELVVLVKPQFEAGRAALDARGVVRSAHLQATAVQRVAQAAAAEGLTTVALADSAITGGAGNREFFLHLVAKAHPQAGAAVSLEEIYHRIVQDGSDGSPPDGHPPSGAAKGSTK